MARPDTQPGVEGGGAEDGPDGATDVVRPGTGVVRPGTGVVRPGTGVVRPGAVTPADAGTAKASAAVPEAPAKPLEPIHVVLPVIPVMPAKQGFLDRLVAPKPKKTEADLAEEEAEREAEEARKAEEAQRKVEEAQRKVEEAQRKAGAQARKAAEEARRAEAEAEAKAEAKADEKARKVEERARKAEEKARRAEAKVREKARDDEADDDYDEDDDYDDYDEPAAPPRGLAGPSGPPTVAPPRPMPPGPTAPPRPGPTAPPRPGPTAPPRPGPGPGQTRPYSPAGPASRPQRAPDRRVDRDDRRVEYAAPARRRPLWHWVAAAVALVALGGGSAAITGAAAPPAIVRFAAGIDTGQTTAILAGLAENAPRPSAAGVSAAVGPLFADSGLGPPGSVAGSIVDATTGDTLYDLNGAKGMTPASSAKLLTAAAVLQTRGPNYRIATRAVAGANPGEVVLVGGGDPTLAVNATSAYHGAARLDLLAEQVRKALGGTAPTRVIIDTSLYQGSTVGPGWADADVKSGVISNITALMTDGARVNPRDTRSNPEHYPQPDVAAGQLFAQTLGLPASAVSSDIAPQGAKVLGEVFSPTVARIVEMMLVDSDNVVAEGMARQVALAKNLPATFAGGAQATRAALTDLGLSSTGVGLVDGSGLSDDNRVSVNQLTAVLVRAASTKYPQLRAILSGLPVAGYSGTLSNRDQGAALGSVRAKTGTLNHVNALAGYVVDADGRLLAFAAVADATNNRGRAEGALDHVAAGVAACGCR